jgi:hypothetical protein
MIAQRVAGLLQGEFVHCYPLAFGVMAYDLTHNNLEYEASSDDGTAMFELDVVTPADLTGRRVVVKNEIWGERLAKLLQTRVYPGLVYDRDFGSGQGGRVRL